MNQYHFIAKDPNITKYIEQMAKWIETNSVYSYEQVLELFATNHEKIDKLFYPYPETIFHDDPAKWAELLATNWGIVEEQELQFI